MTRRERKAINQRVAARERLRQFYRSYKYYIDESINFADKDVRTKLQEIEKFFSLGQQVRNRSDRERRFNIPLTYTDYLDMKSQKKSWPYMFNKQFRKALRELERTYERQWYRNLQILKMLQKQAVKYFLITRKNQYLKWICRVSGEAGEQAKIFRKARLEDAKVLLKDFKEIMSVIRTDAFLNNIEEYINSYVDFFVQCQFRLDKFYENLNNILYDKKDISNKKEPADYLKSEEIKYDLPEWNHASKTAKILEH